MIIRFFEGIAFAIGFCIFIILGFIVVFGIIALVLTAYDYIIEYIKNKQNEKGKL